MSEANVDKIELARANTMQITAKEGEAFLDKNLTEWKKPVLMEHFDDGKAATSDEHNGEESKLAKHTTMLETAKEGNELLGGEVLGDTRQETKRKQSREKSNVKRASTIDKVVQEAKAVFADLDTSEGRSLRKRSAPPPAKDATPPMKKTSTMARTAKEGEEFLKRSNKKSPKKGAKKDEEKPTEEEGEAKTEKKSEETNEKVSDEGGAEKQADASVADDKDKEQEKHDAEDISDNQLHDGETASSETPKETATDDRGSAESSADSENKPST